MRTVATAAAAQSTGDGRPRKRRYATKTNAWEM